MYVYTNRVSMKTVSQLLDYRYKKVYDKLYKRAVRTWGACMSQCVVVERAIREAKFLMGALSKKAVLF